MEKRILGKTNEELSVIGVGGIAFKDVTADDAARVAARAVEQGINFFDVGPCYGDSEERLGPALEPFRDDVFLASKTDMNTRDEARQDLEGSLRRLRTDTLDLYQLHAVDSLDRVEKILGPNGAIRLLAEAREKGLARYVGFSAHTEEVACALMDGFDFDTVLFPINWACWFASEHGKAVLQKAREKNMGTLAIKSLAKRLLDDGEERARPKAWYYPLENPGDAALALRFTLSRNVTCAVSPGNEEQLWWMCDTADRLTPLSEEEEALLRTRAEGRPIFPH